MKTPHEPLTPEERALAQSLSRLGPHGGPSPGLDARVLAAARAAVQEAPAPGGQVPPPRRRWPLGLGPQVSRPHSPVWLALPAGADPSQPCFIARFL